MQKGRHWGGSGSGAGRERLGERLGGARVWAKREDCDSGPAFGGNKTRRLE